MQQEATEVTETTEPIEAPQVETPETETVEAVEETTEEAKESEPKQDRKAKPGLQDRINELTRKQREAEREAAYWRTRAEAPAEKVEAPKKPVVADYADYAEYVEALAEFKADEKIQKVLSERDQSEAKRAKEAVTEARSQTWAERAEVFRAEADDFDDVLSSANIPISPGMHEALTESEFGPQIAYHLAKNPAEAKKIAQLSDAAAARAIGRLEVQFEKPVVKVIEKPATKAPAPIGSLNTAAASGTKSPENMTQTEYEAYRRKSGAWWARN